MRVPIASSAAGTAQRRVIVENAHPPFAVGARQRALQSSVRLRARTSGRRRFVRANAATPRPAIRLDLSRKQDRQIREAARILIQRGMCGFLRGGRRCSGANRSRDEWSREASRHFETSGVALLREDFSLRFESKQFRGRHQGQQRTGVSLVETTPVSCPCAA